MPSHCQYCDGIHGPYACPRVASIEHYPDGTVKAVHFTKDQKPKQHAPDVDMDRPVTESRVITMDLLENH